MVMEDRLRENDLITRSLANDSIIQSQNLEIVNQQK